MFETSTNPFIDLKKNNLIHLYQSLNQPHISPGAGLMAQSASAHMMIFQESAARVSICVGLFFPESEKRVLYKMEPFPAERLMENMPQAESFVGEMGFMMDNCHYASASQEEKAELVRPVVFFYQDLELFYKALQSSETEVKKTKTEASMQREAPSDQQRLFLEQYVSVLSML